jgi:uncharacterized protein YjbI with pentapeptide repeats
MKSATASDLKKRWKKNGENFSRHDEPFSSKPFQQSQFGSHGDLLDFRGYSPQDFSSSSGAYTIENTRAKKVDLSGSRFSTVNFFACKFVECVFDEVVFEEDTRFWRQCEFIDCTFLNATFSNCAFNDVTFLRCTFKGTKWKTKNVFSVCTFQNCTLSSNIKNIDFSDANFDNSKFVGVLENVTFLGWSNVPEKYCIDGEWIDIPIECLPNKMNGIDFSEAELILCNFSQYCHLENIKPPLTDNNCAFHITEEFYNTFTSIIEEKWKKTKPTYYENGIFFANVFYKPDPRLPAAIAHKDNFAKKFGTDFSTQLFEALRLAATQANALIVS